jgi:eukaryotic-like serine/threonine-protein kinase
MGHLELATQVTPRPSSQRRSDSSVARQLRQDIVASWYGGQSPDALAALAAHPELQSDRSVVLDLVYEEFCLRTEAGEAVSIDALCRRFPEYAVSIRKLLDVQGILHQRPDLWMEEDEAHWPELGQTFLKFSLQKELGRGTFARVFLATERALGNRLVVVKVAHRGDAEAEMLGRLTHPNIVPVHSVETEAETGRTAVCMPYLGSATLVDVIKRAFGNSALPASAEVILQAARMPRQAAPAPEGHERPDPALRRASYVEGVVHLGVQLADALAYTHAKGICHLDLKPSNVLLRPSGRPMLLDFNLSRDQNLTASMVGGTLPYMSPEQLKALETRGGELDARCDLFSLGVILYELLSGAMPFGKIPDTGAACDLRALLRSQHSQGVKPLCDLNPQVDRRLAAVIERCLELDPAERFASAGELSAALAKFLAGPARLRRWARTHTKALCAAGLVLLLTATAAGYGVATRDPYNQRRFEAGRQAYSRGDYELALTHFEEALRDQPAMTEAQRALARTHQQLGRFEKASLLYRNLPKECEDGSLLAAIGYCDLKNNQYQRALRYLRAAVDAGETTAANLTNLGYCYRHLSSNDLGNAEAALRRACQLDPQQAAAHENLVLVHCRRGALALSQRGRGGEGLVSPSWQADLERALAAPNAPASLYHAAARTFAIMAALEPDADHASTALDCLQNAVRLGSSVQSLEDSAFMTLRDEPRFQVLVRAAQANGGVTPIALTVDPAPAGTIR